MSNRLPETLKSKLSAPFGDRYADIHVMHAIRQSLEPESRMNSDYTLQEK